MSDGPKDANAKALEMIRDSSLIDFESAFEWAQWCRDVARAAEFDDHEELISLERTPQ